MKDKEEFYNVLTEIDGLQGQEYARLVGDYDFSRFILKIMRVPQHDLSEPGMIIVRIPQSTAGFPPHLFNTPVRRTALEDLLTRKIADYQLKLARFRDDGTARRHLLICAPGQKILPRSTVMVMDDNIEARIYVHFPLKDQLIHGTAAKQVFFDDLPEVVGQTMIHCNLDQAEVERFVDIMEDADAIRHTLSTRGLVGFVAEDSLLPRVGNSDLPDYERDSFISVADAVRLEVEVPNAGTVKGFGIPAGITLILGDDFSGRQELLRAIADGIYNHVPGDGREFTVTVPDAVYISAEPHRSIQRVNLSPFMPSAGAAAQNYTSNDAGPVVSQAAALMEMLEVGARAVLMDESESAAGFLAGDSRLSGLLGESAFLPLSACARKLVDDLGVSLVLAGSNAVAEFIPVADTVLMIKDFKVSDITAEARSLFERAPANAATAGSGFGDLVEKARWVVPSSIDASLGRHDAAIEAKSIATLHFGRHVIDLSKVVQLADTYQTATIGLILYYARQRYLDEGRPIREILDLVDRDLSTEGLECLSRELRGDLARPRRYEIAAALNRLSTLRISHAEK